MIFPEEIPDQICCSGEARGKGCAMQERSSLPHFMLTFTMCSQGCREFGKKPPLIPGGTEDSAQTQPSG